MDLPDAPVKPKLEKIHSKKFLIFFIFREIEFSVFSQQKPFLIFRETETPTKIPYM